MSTQAASGLLGRVPWKQIRDSLSRDLMELLDHALLERTPLWKASYPYSHLIVDKGHFECPNGADQVLERELRVALGGQVPLCIVLKGSAEVFDLQGQPLQLIRRYRMFGVYEALDHFLKIPQTNSKYYSVSSGCRSLHVVGDLGNARVMELLGNDLGTVINWKEKKKQHRDSEEQRHYNLVRQAMAAKEPWLCELIVLPAKAASKALKNADFAAALLKLGWRQTAHARSYVVHKERLRRQCDHVDGLPTYLLSQFLLSVQEGNLPAYRLTHQVRSDSGPFGDFQSALYRALKKGKSKESAFPFMLQAEQLDPGDNGFYSFNCAQKAFEPLSNKTPHMQCKAMQLMLDDSPGFNFFVNGDRLGRPLRKDSGGKSFPKINPLGPAHRELTPEDFEPANCVGLVKIEPKDLHLATGFFNAAVLIQRPKA